MEFKSNKFKMADSTTRLDDAFEKACQVFSVSKLYPEQKKALRAFVTRQDVFVNLPTGYGKSLVFQMAPFVHSELGNATNPIVIVISPLISLMQDQTEYLRSLNIKAAFIGEDKLENLSIEKGECSVVYSSPESLLGNGRWRNMLSSSIYQKNLVGIAVDEAHCISHW